MPRNDGVEPPVVTVDIRYRNGQIVRNITARDRRWSINDPEYPPDYAFDIVSWQRAGSGEGRS